MKEHKVECFDFGDFGRQKMTDKMDALSELDWEVHSIMYEDTIAFTPGHFVVLFTREVKVKGKKVIADAAPGGKGSLPK